MGHGDNLFVAICFSVHRDPFAVRLHVTTPRY